MIEQHNNSTIYRDVDEEYTDLSFLGGSENPIIKITEQDNGFLVGDALYYDFKTNHYRRALAFNQIMSEVIGVVSKIFDKDTFELTLKGSIILDRYDDVTDGDLLYLSSNVSGKLVKDEPYNISKIIAVKEPKGIFVDIQRGFYLNKENTDNLNFRYYTEQEIQDLVTRIKNDIY